MNNQRFLFRVWDVKRKLYVLPGDLFFAIDDGSLWEQDFPIDNSDNHLVIEQSTGITDKNGRLIFEGDVLGVRCSDGVLIAYCVVWHEGAFHLLDPKSEFVNVATVCALRGNVRNDTCGYREIIGNIHENKVWK